MKGVRHLLMGAAMILAALVADVASASTTWGKVTFVGTFTQEYAQGYHARLRVRVHGTCDADGAAADRWIIIRSGRMDDIYAHNSVNMRNAYSTLMAALLSGKNVQIGGLSDCSMTDVIDMDLWTGDVGLF
jgi:hypothetical protein